MVGDVSIGVLSLEAIETSSISGSGSTRRGSSRGVFSRMRSSKASPFAVVLWLNDPPAAMSNCRADSLCSPSQKCCNNTWLGIDKSGPEWVRIKNLSQAAPMVSFSCCWKLRILLTPFLDMYPGSVEYRSARRGNSDWSAGELPIRVVADEETAECD